jgi:hypothetical protein
MKLGDADMVKLAAGFYHPLPSRMKTKLQRIRRSSTDESTQYSPATSPRR